MMIYSVFYIVSIKLNKPTKQNVENDLNRHFKSIKLLKKCLKEHPTHQGFVQTEAQWDPEGYSRL